MSETFRDEFAKALASVHPVCAKYVKEEGLPLECKRIAVECSVNLLVDMISRLPEASRVDVTRRISHSLQSFVVAEMESKGRI